ncbi:MAG: AAA family ATPase [Planctomycetales bacterium]|nr:AAA family ATPase [Planctomycetales bacterium]
MKICQLDLIAFGHFTDVTLSFPSEAHGLHIVCGPNEAGKSSSLRALRQLLFGIPHTSTDAYIHSNQSLRIGARLQDSDGQPLVCIRRKGRTKTLRGADDVEVLDPAQLQVMLGNMDEATFSQRFGIDYDELRRGGKAVAQGGGDLGEMLFAAGAGVADLGQIQQGLVDEASDLFLPKGSKPAINSALAKLKEARRDISRSQLLTSAWVQHDKALRTAEKRQEEIDLELRDRRTQQSRWDRMGKALPLIARRHGLQKQLSTVVDAALLPEDFSGNRREACTQLANAQQAKLSAEKACENLRASIAKLDISEELLAHRSAITSLHTELGSFQKATKDRPGLAVLLQQYERQAQAILQELGRQPDLQQASELQLKRAQRQKIQSLAGDCKALLNAQHAAEAALGELRGELQELESQFSDTAEPLDTSELKRVMRQVQKHGDLDEQCAEAQDDLRRLQTDAEIDLQKLRLWSGPLDELERLPVPASETVERFENGISDTQAKIASLTQRIEELRQTLQKLTQNLERLRLEQDVPSEDDLSRARELRDEGWKLVLQSWRADTAADEEQCAAFVAQFAPHGDLPRAFQAAIEAADQLSDRLRREADRVAEKAKLTADQQELVRRLEEQQSNLPPLEQELEKLHDEWRSLWRPLRIEPLSPREMRSWLGQQAALAQAAAALRKRRETVETLQAERDEQRIVLNQVLQALGQMPAGIDEPLATVLLRCEDLVAENEKLASERRVVAQKLRELRPKLTRRKDAAAEAQAAVELWRTQWASAVAQLGLEGDAEPAVANSVIESIDELLSLIEKGEDTRHRIAGIDRDAEQFATVVSGLLSQLATDLLELPVEQAVADLYDRLEATGKAQTKCDGWSEQLQQEEAKRANAAAQVLHWQSALQAMCREAGCESPEELPAAELRSTTKREWESELLAIDEQLVTLAGGMPLEEFIADAGQQDPDQVNAHLDALKDEIGQLEQRKSDESETIGAERTELRRMDGSGLAAEAQTQAEHCLAQIRSDAEQYIRLRLASAVLRKSIERFREQNKDPVLLRASELFSELTLGSFVGLRADYDEKGNPVLVGVRPDGKRSVGVEGMSEGTCDQLYLALRLSLLESYLGQREPIPFIVDDILVMFDDDRAVAALRALHRLAEQTQVIYFTHHEHIVHLARQHLGDRLFTHRLDSPLDSSR